MNAAVLESWMRMEGRRLVEEATLGMHLGQGPQRLGFQQEESGFGLGITRDGLGGRRDVSVVGNSTSVLLCGSQSRAPERAGPQGEMGVTCRETHFDPEEKRRLEGESTARAERSWSSRTGAPRSRCHLLLLGERGLDSQLRCHLNPCPSMSTVSVRPWGKCFRHLSLEC